ncbi:hypothetical protein [Nocardia wallacei]|uniref:hypothetical protein n=1 Tax=Nocardia wallacei TaxID=480035 RepID=UPI0024572A0E|nr:hypothetical protein [Nocardia wallacei]
MTSSEPHPHRRQSKLSEDELWEVPANPPPATTKPAPATKPADQASRTDASRVDARTREMRGHARDLAEARGRKTTRDAAYAWAAAAKKARDREIEFGAELAAALQRGTDRALLATYIHEACDRYGVDPAQLTSEIRAQVGPAPTPE